MTILVDISELAYLKALVACIDAGEDIVLTRDGRTVATINIAKPDAHTRIRRVPGLFAHLGPMEDPDLFLRPDPELWELAESHDEDEFYRPQTPKT